jgi:hypothetical protein
MRGDGGRAEKIVNRGQKFALAQSAADGSAPR